MVNFSTKPPVPTHIEHGDYNLPVKYNSEDDTINYSMNGPMINPIDDDVDINIPISDYPDDALVYLYRSVKKTNNKITFDDGNKRWNGLSERLYEELHDRDINIPDTELAYKVRMNKSQAMNTSLEKVPVIIKIGETPEEDYEFGMSPEEMIWEVLTTKRESEYLKNKYSDINIIKV